MSHSMSMQEPTGDGETLADLARAFVRDPGERTLASLRHAILLDPGFDPLVPVSGTAAGMTGPRELIKAFGARQPSLLLSPSAHAMLSRAFAEIGEESSAKVESLLAELSLEALRSSGDGTHESPYRVLRVEDEYDLLAAEGRRSVRQVDRGDRDVHTLDDGTTREFLLMWRTGAGLTG